MTKYGRLFQDENFVVQGFDGEILEQLVGVEIPERLERGPILFYIKTKNGTWQQFFLDVCFAVWENWGEIDEEEDDAYRYVDYAEKLGLKNQIIRAIYCQNNEITIDFENNKKFVLKYTDPTVFDGDREVIFI